MKETKKEAVITQTDRDELAEQIRGGYTSGRLDNGEGKHISWELTTEVWTD